jgi:hypothetical protein
MARNEGIKFAKHVGPSIGSLGIRINWCLHQGVKALIENRMLKETFAKAGHAMLRDEPTTTIEKNKIGLLRCDIENAQKHHLVIWYVPTPPYEYIKNC